MTKKTRKVGITGKYGTRYGSALRKIIKKFEVSQHARYLCPFCGKEAVRRNAIGIWNCSGCGISVAGGAWELTYLIYIKH
jgi:large subunit ribosomal protein L37Ae